MREITIKIYLDKFYTLKTKSDRTVLEEYLIDIFGSNLKIYENRIYLTLSKPKNILLLVFDKQMRAISLGDFIPNIIIMYCFDLNFITKYLDLPNWQKMNDHLSEIENDHPFSVVEVIDEKDKKSEMISCTKVDINEKSYKNNSLDKKKEIRENKRISEKLQKLDRNPKKEKKVVISKENGQSEIVIKTSKVEMSKQKDKKYNRESEESNESYDMADIQDSVKKNHFEKILELIKENEKSNDTRNSKNVEEKEEDKNMQENDMFLSESVELNHKMKNNSERKELKRNNDMSTPKTIHFVVKMDNGKQQVAVVQEEKKVQEKNSSKNLDHNKNMAKPEIKEIDTSGSDVVSDVNSGKCHTDENIDNGVFKQNGDNKKSEEQKIIYTIISPSGEIIYNKVIVNEKSITVEELLLKSGLNIVDSNGFVESIEGFKNEGMSGWVFEVNNAQIMVPASEYIVNPNDKITWKYVDFSKMIEDAAVDENKGVSKQENVKVKSIFNEK